MWLYGAGFDSETGLYYYRSRYYDSVVGRFISEDPIGFAGGDANLYRYVGNSATNAIDPYGLFDEARGRDDNGNLIGLIWMGIAGAVAWLGSEAIKSAGSFKDNLPVAKRSPIQLPVDTLRMLEVD
ncbi:RHS repeat-associated core domain-containing protein [Tumidithrix helvetica]|uniref:RHS repeat-associated core domain-containing protein n=1 Tax=Tumidithrix helvetica TaxID=3457545 RepID=UPI003CC62311